MLKRVQLLACLFTIIIINGCKTSTTSSQGNIDKNQEQTIVDAACVEDMIIITLKGQVKQKQIEYAFGKKYGLDWFSAYDSPLNEGIYYFSPALISLEELIGIMKTEQFSTDARCITKQELDGIH